MMGGLLFDDIAELLQDIECFLYTTASNATGERWRLVVPLTDIVEYESHKAASASFTLFVNERNLRKSIK
jgi:hypothetical protein